MGVRALAVSFARVQRAEAKSPHTVKLYADCIGRLVRFLEAETGTDDVAGLSRRLLTDFYAVRAESVAPATVWTDFKVHRVFLRWLVSEDEPPAGYRPPPAGYRRRAGSAARRSRTRRGSSPLARSCPGRRASVRA